MQLLDLLLLLVGQDLGEVSIQGELFRDLPGRSLIVTGQHPAMDAPVLQRLHGSLRGIAQAIGQSERSNQLIADQHVHAGGTGGTALIVGGATLIARRTAPLTCGTLDALLLQIARTDDLDLLAVDGSAHTLALDRLDVLGCGHLHLSLPGAAGDSGGNRVLGLGLDRGGVGQEPLFVPVVFVDGDVLNLEGALGQRTGLVEHHRRDAPGVLEGGSVADQEAVAGRAGGGDAGHERNGQPQGMRAGDDHDSGHARDGELEVTTGEQPGGEGRDPHRDRGDREPQRGAVGEVLGAALGTLRLLDHVDDLGQIGVLSRAAHFELERAVAVDRPTDEFVALSLCHGARFAGEHGFVDVARALPDDTIGGDLLPGLDHQHIAFSDLRERNIFNRVAFSGVGPFAVSSVGHETRQLLQCGGCRQDRAHLDPVARQHDIDQGGQLPEEGAPLESDDHGGGVGVGHRDRKGDQGHHPRRLLRQLVTHAGQERPAAVEVDAAADGEHDPGPPRHAEANAQQ